MSGTTDGTAEESGGDDRPTILAVDDEKRVGQAFDLWLGDDYRVLTATSGSEALEQMDDDVDVVLLDRHMPGMSGDDVLKEIRAEEYDTRVAMVTAVDPDFDIVDMAFDHYVSKPVDEEKLRTVVDRLLALDEYDSHAAALYTIDQKIATLETEKNRERLAEDERYEELLAERERRQEAADELIAEMDDGDVAELFKLTPDGEE